MRWLACLVFIAFVSGRSFCHAQDGVATDNYAKSISLTSESSPEITAIQAQSEAFVDAFNQHDAKAIAALWTVDAEYVDDSGVVHAGRESIEQVYGELFAANPDRKIQVVVDSLRMLNDSVAIEDGRALVEPPPAGAAGVSKYTAVHVKVNGQWLMASVRDSWVETPATRQSTADLGWLIGSWVAEERGVRMNSTCRWVANEHFVQRDFTTTQVDGETSSGVQLIGWNPSIGRVQSWTFSPDGGNAVGTWSLTSTGWVAETLGVTTDGTPTTASIELRRLDDNAYVWQSFNRTIGGTPLPDTDEIVIKRVADEE